MTSHQHILWRYMGLLLFSFQFQCLLSYSDVEEKEVESNSIQPSASLICRTKETCFSFFVLFLNKATGKKTYPEFAMDGFACGTETRDLEAGFPRLCLLSGGGGGGGGGGGVGGVGGRYWMSEWIFTDVALW